MTYFICLLWLLGAAGGFENGSLSMVATLINMLLAFTVMWCCYRLKGSDKE